MMTIPTVKETEDHADQFPLYPAGDLAPRIVGREGFFRLASAATRAGYREDSPNNSLTLQDAFATQPDTPIGAGFRSEADYGLVITSNPEA